MQAASAQTYQVPHLHSFLWGLCSPSLLQHWFRHKVTLSRMRGAEHHAIVVVDVVDGAATVEGFGVSDAGVGALRNLPDESRWRLVATLWRVSNLYRRYKDWKKKKHMMKVMTNIVVHEVWRISNSWDLSWSTLAKHTFTCFSSTHNTMKLSWIDI